VIDLSRAPNGLPYSFPVVYCCNCNAVRAVDLYVDGFPPDVAKRKLIKSCKAHGCKCDPHYLAGARIDPIIAKPA
jgi:hypothetical protein